MRSSQRLWVVVLSATLLVSSAATAQDTDTAMQAMPADTMGFLIVDNISRTLNNAHQYLQDIGLAQMFMSPDTDLVQSVRQSLQLGDGFDPQGSFGAAMLDPLALGMDIERLVDTAVDTGESERMPFVLYVPGSGVREVFGAYPIEPSGEYELIQFPAGPMYAAHKGKHVILSPLSSALSAAMNGEGTAWDSITDEQRDRLRQADMGGFVNMHVAGPVIMQMIERTKSRLEARDAAELDEEQKATLRIIPIYQRLLPQIESVEFATNFTDEALRFDEFIKLDPSSEMGRAIASARKPEGPPLDRLTDNSYAMAMGVASSEGSLEVSSEWIDGALSGIPEVSEQTRVRMRDHIIALGKEVSAWQFVIGQAPEGSGVLGMSLVLDVREAQAARRLLEEISATLQQALSEAGPEDLRNISITYQTQAQTIEDVSGDAVIFTGPQMDTPEARARMQTVFGEEQMRILVLPAQQDRLVLTLGGSQAYAREALVAAREGGSLVDNPDIRKALDRLSENPFGVLLLDGANLSKLVNRMEQAMNGTDTSDQMSITTHTPLAFTLDIDESLMHGALAIPNDLVKDMFHASMGMGAPPVSDEPTQEPAGSEAF